MEQKTNKKLHDEILGALEILNSHGYGHYDAHLGNVVDCGELSEPQYKLIDFGNMRPTMQYYKNAHSDKLFFEARIEGLPKSGGNKLKRSRSARRTKRSITRSNKRTNKRKRSRTRSTKKRF
jgi:hypothetical protein